MNRRDFSRQLTVWTGLGLAAGTAAQAQEAPVEGRHYVRLNTPATTLTPAADKKVEVVEFFGYWCPACYAFEPTLEAWAKTWPAAAVFRRIPVVFNPAHQSLQKAFFALDDMGQLPVMHRKIFNAIHQQKKRLDGDAEVSEFVASQGVDAAKFKDAFGSFSVDSRIKRARQLSQEYKIDGVPTLGVQGRFFTSPSMSGGLDRAAAVLNFLIQRSRQRT